MRRHVRRIGRHGLLQQHVSFLVTTMLKPNFCQSASRFRVSRVNLQSIAKLKFSPCGIPLLQVLHCRVVELLFPHGRVAGACHWQKRAKRHQQEQGSP